MELLTVIRNAYTVSRWLLAEAIEIVRSSQRGGGRWSLQHRWQSKTYFELERLGAPAAGTSSARCAC